MGGGGLICEISPGCPQTTQLQTTLNLQFPASFSLLRTGDTALHHYNWFVQVWALNLGALSKLSHIPSSQTQICTVLELNTHAIRSPDLWSMVCLS